MKKYLATLALAAPLTAASVHGLSYFDRDLLWEDASLFASAFAVGTVALVGIRGWLDYSSTPRVTHRLPVQPAVSAPVAPAIIETHTTHPVGMPTIRPARVQRRRERIAA